MCTTAPGYKAARKLVSILTVSYTHLDVYKRQVIVSYLEILVIKVNAVEAIDSSGSQ